MNTAFTAELAKLANVTVSESKDGKLGRAVKSLAAIGAGAGLGYASGRALGRAIAPQMQNMSPGAQGWVRGLATGGLLAAGVGTGALLSRAGDYVEKGDRNASRKAHQLRAT